MGKTSKDKATQSELPSKGDKRYLKILVFSMLVVSLLFTRFDDRLFAGADDNDYFATATSIAYLQFPFFNNEDLSGNNTFGEQQLPYATGFGAGILASPFVFVGSLVDRLENAPIETLRTAENIQWTWSMLGFQLSSFFYLIFGAILLFFFCRLYLPSKESFYATFASILGSGLFAYVSFRPVMSHVYDFFILTFSLYLVEKIRRKQDKIWTATFAGLIFSFVFLVRHQNAIIALTLVAYTLWVYRQRQENKSMITLLLAFSVSIVFWRILPMLFVTYDERYVKGAGATLFSRDTNLLEVETILSRTFTIFASPGMGMAFTSSAVFMGLILYLIGFKKLPKYQKFFAFSILINLFLVYIWNSFGSYYGYRYFVFTAIPLFVIPLGRFFLLIRSNLTKSIICLSLVFFPLLSLLYWTSSADYAVQIVSLDSAGFEYYDINHQYHINALREFINQPLLQLSNRLNLGIRNVFPSSLVSSMPVHNALFSEMRYLGYVFLSLSTYLFATSSSFKRWLVRDTEKSLYA